MSARIDRIDEAFYRVSHEAERYYSHIEQEVERRPIASITLLATAIFSVFSGLIYGETMFQGVVHMARNIGIVIVVTSFFESVFRDVEGC